MEIEKIEYLAELSKLKFSQEELVSFSKEIDSLMELADVVKNADIENGINYNIVDMNDLREDEIKPSTPTADLLQNSPVVSRNSIVVPRIME